MTDTTEVPAVKGYAGHSRQFEQTGFPGDMRRPIKVTLIGAGSGFTPILD